MGSGYARLESGMDGTGAQEDTKAEPDPNGLPVKHNDVFHCLYEGKVLVSSRRTRVGPTSPGRSLQP